MERLRSLDHGYCYCMMVLTQEMLSGGTNSVRYARVWRLRS